MPSLGWCDPNQTIRQAGGSGGRLPAIPFTRACPTCLGHVLRLLYSLAEWLSRGGQLPRALWLALMVADPIT